jgi:molybdate transport system substrate-binding protein
VIAPPDAITQAAKDGKLAADTRVMVGRVGAGVVVRSDAATPDIASADALKRTLLAADSVVYNTASSGIYLDKLFDKMGILDQLKPKTTRYPGGSEVMAHLSKGKGNEIGFGAITEIKAYEPKGVRLVGPLPAEVQNLHELRSGDDDRQRVARCGKSGPQADRCASQQGSVCGKRGGITKVSVIG